MTANLLFRFTFKYIHHPKYSISTFQLFNLATSTDMTIQQRKQFCCRLCCAMDSKRLCGQVANIFTSDLSQEEAASFMYDIVTLDFFLDLEGNMQDFLKQVRKPAREVLEHLVSSSFNTDTNGDILESDADSDGNLR